MIYFIYKDFYDILFKVDDVLYDDFCDDPYILFKDIFFDEFSGRYAVMYLGRKYYLNVDKMYNGVAFVNGIKYNRIYLTKGYVFMRLSYDMYKEFVDLGKKVYIYNGLDYV